MGVEDTVRQRPLSPWERVLQERTSLSADDRRAGAVDTEWFHRAFEPLRLEWAMEAAQMADLAAGPVSVTQDGVTVTLAIDADAQPELSVRRGEKVLKAIPPAVRKHPKVAALAERRTELKRSASRV